MSRQGYAEFFIAVGSISALCTVLGILGIFCWLGVSLLMSGLWILFLGFAAASFWAYIISGKGLTFQQWFKNFSFTFAILGSFICSAFILFWTLSAAGWWALALALLCAWHLAHLQHLKGKVWFWLAAVGCHSLLLYLSVGWVCYFLLGLTGLVLLLEWAMNEHFGAYMLFNQQRQTQHWFGRQLSLEQWKLLLNNSSQLQTEHFIDLYINECILAQIPPPTQKIQALGLVFWQLVENPQFPVVNFRRFENAYKLISLAGCTEFIGSWLQKATVYPHLKTNLEDYAARCGEILAGFIQKPDNKSIAQKLQSQADLEAAIDAFYPQIPADFENLQLVYGLLYPAIGVAKNSIAN